MNSSTTGVGLIRLGAATLLTGLLSGLAGMGLGLLLHAIQHLAYGYGLDPGTPHESFLEGVRAAAPARRVAALTACALTAGAGWALLYRYGRPLVRIAAAVEGQAMPVMETIVHGLLQIATVALGSPLGREVAPREMGALLAGRIVRAFALPAADARLVIASGAGAGLAAVYNVPFASAVFVLETMAVSVAPRAVAVAMAACATGALVARLGLGNAPVYSVPLEPATPALIAFAVLTGPVFGAAGYAFARLTSAARRAAPRGGRLLLACAVVFPLLGLLAIPFPALLGNGKAILQLEFAGAVEAPLAAALLALRFLLPVAALGAGAEGGLLTPATAVGALLATLLSAGWVGSAAGYALVGATAVLAASSRMPLAAVALLLEFTGAPAGYLAAMIAATAGATAVQQWLAARGETVAPE